MSQASSYALPKVLAGEKTAVIPAIPEDALTYAREILKFLGTVAMIAVTGLLLLLAG
jgi:hypothetical protein